MQGNKARVSHKWLSVLLSSRKINLKFPTMQKESFTEQVPDSNDLLESLQTQEMFITQGDPKPIDQVQGSKEHRDNLLESLQSQEMFITQREPKLKDQVSDLDKFFESSQEMFVTQRDSPNPKDRVSFFKNHPDEDRTNKNRKSTRQPNKQFRRKLLRRKVKDLQEKKRVVMSSQTSSIEGTQRAAQFGSIDELFVPTQNQRCSTQMFNVSCRDTEPVLNHLQDLISPMVAEDGNKEDPDMNISSTDMTASTSSQTDLTLEQMQSQKNFNSCVDCEFLLLTAETLMLLVRVIYDNSRFRDRTLSSSMPDRLHESERKMAHTSSLHMRSSSKDMGNSFLKQIRSLKENLGNNFRSKDKDMEDSGYLDDTDTSQHYHLESDTKSHNNSNTAKNLETKKRKLQDTKTKRVKKRKKKDEIEKLGKSQKKKKKDQTIKKSCGWESLLDSQVESLRCPHELKQQWKKKRLLGETLVGNSATSKSKKLSKRRNRSKAVRGDAISSEFESYQEVKALEKRLLKKTEKPKKEGRKPGRVKTKKCKIRKNCCNPPDVKVKHEKRKRQGKLKHRF